MSYPYVYPYGHIVGPIMIEVLVIGVALFMGFSHARKYVLFCLFVAALFETFYTAYPDGVAIGWLTLTCVGILAVFHFIKMVGIRILAGLSFIALGCFLLNQTFFFMSTADVFGYMLNLTAWAILLSWALTALAGGILLLIAAIRKRFIA